MIKHRSITLRILDALAKTSHVGMTYPQIVRLAWRLSHPRVARGTVAARKQGDDAWKVQGMPPSEMPHP